MLQGVSLHGGKENLSYEDNTRVRGIHPAGKEMALRLEEHALEYVLATFRGWWWGISVANDPFRDPPVRLGRPSVPHLDKNAPFRVLGFRRQ